MDHQKSQGGEVGSLEDARIFLPVSISACVEALGLFLKAD